MLGLRLKPSSLIIWFEGNDLSGPERRGNAEVKDMQIKIMIIDVEVDALHQTTITTWVSNIVHQRVESGE